MKKKVFSVAALWLALALLVFAYTDRNEYTWSFSGGETAHVLTTAQQADEAEAAYAAAMAIEKAEAAARSAAGEWGKDDQYGGAPIASPAVDEEHGLNLMWGTYDVTVRADLNGTAGIRAVSAGRQPFIRGGEAALADGETAFSFTLTDSTEHLSFACDLPAGARIEEITVHKRGAGMFSADLAAYAALAGAVLTVLLVLSWDRSAAGYENRRDALFVVLTALFASMPLLWSGVYAGHDLLFHLNRIEGIAAGMRAGQFPVRIHASTLLGYGYASSQFYPELFMYFPALLRNLGVSLSASVRVFEMAIHLAAAAVCYFSCRSLFKDRLIALGATALYVLCPYRLANIYVRATIAESIAMIFFPLLILAMAEVLTRDERKWPLLAVSMTCIFLTHLLSTMFAAALCALAAVCCAKKLIAQPRRILAIVKAAAMTVVCSLVFLVPFADYTLNTYISTSVAIDASAHVMRFGSLLVGFPGEVTELPYDALDFSYTVGMVPGLALLLGCAMLCVRLYAGGISREGESRDRFAASMLAMGALCLAGATELFPWDWACSLRRPFSTLFMQIQYPWRLVGVAAPMLSMAAAWGFMRDEKHRKTALAAIVALNVVLSGYVMQIYVQDVPLIQKESYCDTRIGQYEYTYERTEKSALVPGEIVAGKAENYSVREYEKQGTNLSFVIDAPEGCAYTDVPLLYYPGYHAMVNGEPALRIRRGADNNNVLRIYGVFVPGENSVSIWFDEPPLWTASSLASLAGALVLAAKCLNMGRKAKRRHA